MSRRTGYDDVAEAWASGAELVYGPLAAALVAECSAPLAGQLMLDVGAGTGAASRALTRAGARVVAVDLSHGMLAYRSEERPPAVVGEVVALPVRSGGTDGAVAAFVLNHVDRPVAALTELHRVVRPGGAVLATVFSNDDRPPLKDLIDDAAASFGWAPPAWYAEFKLRAAPLLGSGAAMREAAAAAGLVDVDVDDRPLDVGTYSPEQLVAYRLGHAHLAPFVRSLPAWRRRRLVAAALDSVGAEAIRYAPRVVRLAARSQST